MPAQKNGFLTGLYEGIIIGLFIVKYEAVGGAGRANTIRGLHCETHHTILLVLLLTFNREYLFHYEKKRNLQRGSTPSTF